MGKIADLAKQTNKEESKSILDSLSDYISNSPFIDALGSRIDDIAKGYGLEHGLTGTIARYIEDLEGRNTPEAKWHREFGHRQDENYNKMLRLYKIRDYIMQKYNLPKEQAVALAEEIIQKQSESMAYVDIDDEVLGKANFMENVPPLDLSPLEEEEPIVNFLSSMGRAITNRPTRNNGMDPEEIELPRR